MEYIPAGKTKVEGADFTVAAGSPVGLSCYGGGSGAIGRVEQKNSDGSYTPLMARLDPAKAPVQVVLSGLMSSLTVVKPGTFRVVKFSSAEDTGIDKD